jgi:hypothetical protein
MNIKERTLQENPPTLKVKTNYPFAKEGNKYGVIIGLIMAAYLFLLNATTNDIDTVFKMLKNLAFIPFIGLALFAYKQALPEGKIFKDGIKLIARIGVVSGLTLAVANIIVFLLIPEISFQQFMNEGDSIGDVLINSSFLAGESFVFAMTIGFCYLQFLKSGGSPDDTKRRES